MILKEIIEQDLQVIESDLGNQVFTWNGEDYICAPAGTNENSSMIIGGIDVRADVILNVRRSVFADNILPRPMLDTITYNGTRYHIGKRIYDVTNTFVQLYLLDNTQD